MKEKSTGIPRTCGKSHLGERGPRLRVDPGMNTSAFHTTQSGADVGLRYWEERRRDRGLPSRADIDPLDIPDLLPPVFLVNVLREPLDFRYRLLGTQIVRHSAADYTGKSLRELPEQCPPSRIWSLFQRVVEERRPSSAKVPYIYIPGKSVEMLATPLSDDGANVNMIFGVVQFDPSVAEPRMILPKRNQVAF